MWKLNFFNPNFWRYFASNKDRLDRLLTINRGIQQHETAQNHQIDNKQRESVFR
jgi:hypothetical protein